MQKQVSQTPQTIETLTIADAEYQAFGLIYIALQNGYFKDEGLEVKFNTFRFGREALADVVAGNADIATVFETPLIRQIYEGQKLSIIASLHKSNAGTGIIALKKREINNVLDLKDKKIAVTKGTNAEFFLYSLLTSHGLKIGDVKLIDVAPVDIQGVLRDGSVDAVSTFHPHLDNIENTFPREEIVTFYSEIYTENSVLAGKTEVVKSKKEAFTRLLKALVKAEDFYKLNREESIQAIAKSLTNTPESTIRNIWEDYNLSLNLDNVLLTILNREGQWFKDNGIYTTELPDFRKAIFTDYLKSVKPEAVTLY
jgi:NitT/TauT family transport system substrate-binding protein